MKKLARWALCLGLCLALLVCGALADEAPGITVQLDGQALVFTDAVPQVKDQRTFLPFRAVFEAMGAQVDYEGSVITAARGDKTLIMTLDSTHATLMERGAPTPITMDVAPYVDPATWRTYVPVRFAAQAFGCVVGWDQEAQTAIVIDTEKLVNAAVEGKDFTYLDKLSAMGERYNEGIWDITATFDADASMMGMSLTTIQGTVKGAVQDGSKLSADMTMRADFTSSLSALNIMNPGSVTAEDKAIFDSLAKDGVKLAMRGNMDTGKLYLSMDLGALNAQANVDSDAWYELDMAAMTEQNGVAWADLMATSRNADMMDMIVAMLATAQPTHAATAYAEVKAMVDDCLATFSDQGFALVDGQYVATYAWEQDDNAATLVLVLDMDGDTLKGYVVGMDMAAQDKDGRSMDMSVSVSLDDKGQMNAQVTMDMGGLMGMTMTMEGAYTSGTAAPAAAPPAGAKVLPFTSLAGGNAGLGVIGGSDGPTTVLVG